MLLINVLSVYKECSWRVLLSVLKCRVYQTVLIIIVKLIIPSVLNVRRISIWVSKMCVLLELVFHRFLIVSLSHWQMKHVLYALMTLLWHRTLKSVSHRFQIARNMNYQTQIVCSINVKSVKTDFTMTKTKSLVRLDLLRNVKLTIKTPTLVKHVKIDST